MPPRPPTQKALQLPEKTDYIIYEPPKHTFYNIDTSGQWGVNGQIVNVSRYPNFNVTFTQGNTTSMQTSSTSTSDWTICGSATIGGSYSASGGVDVGLVNVDVQVTGGFSATLGYSHNRSKQSTDSKFSTSSVTYATTTSADDTIGGTVQTLDVWRYRVYGMPPSDLKNSPGGFYDYIIPGNIVKMPGNAGMDLDWYQPLPSGIFPGQNNEGYGYATLQASNPGGTCSPGFDANVSLRKNSLTALDAVNKKIRDDNPRLFVNQPARLRLRVYSDKPHGLFGHVLIYDGKPNRGGKLIADKLVHTGDPNGATVWFDWVPTTKGKHVLYARYLGRRADPHKKLHRDILRVNVMDVVPKRDQ